MDNLTKLERAQAAFMRWLMTKNYMLLDESEREAIEGIPCATCRGLWMNHYGMYCDPKYMLNPCKPFLSERKFEPDWSTYHE